MGKIFIWIRRGQVRPIPGLLTFIRISIAKKDDLLIESAKTVTAALAAASASNIELRRIIEESVAAKRELASSIEGLRTALQKLPCVDPSTWDTRHHGQGRE